MQLYIGADMSQLYIGAAMSQSYIGADMSQSYIGADMSQLFIGAHMVSNEAASLPLRVLLVCKSSWMGMNKIRSSSSIESGSNSE